MKNVFLAVLILSLSFLVHCKADCRDVGALLKKYSKDQLITQKECQEFSIFLQKNQKDLQNCELFEQLTSSEDIIYLIARKTNLPVGSIECDSSHFSFLQKEGVKRFNFFIDPSGSMKGYVNGNTEFKTILGEVLTDLYGKNNELRISYVGKSLQDLEINNFSELKQIASSPFSKATNEFLIHEATSEFFILLEQILKTIKKDSKIISIFFTDNIYIPPQTNQNLSIDSESSVIKSILTRKLSEVKFNTLVTQCFSKFDGEYTDFKGNKTFIKKTRPFYVWSFAEEGIFQDYLKTNYQKFRDKFSKFCPNDVLFQSGSVDYILSYHDKKGELEIDRDTKILHLRSAGKDGTYSFSIAFNPYKISTLEESNDNFFLSKENYDLNSPFEIVNLQKISNLKLPKQESNLTKYKYLATIQLNELSNDTILNFQISNRMPDWITRSTSEDDTRVDERTTYGLKSLLQGILYAYEDPKPIKINIKRK